MLHVAWFLEAIKWFISRHIPCKWKCTFEKKFSWPKYFGYKNILKIEFNLTSFFCIHNWSKNDALICLNEYIHIHIYMCIYVCVCVCVYIIQLYISIIYNYIFRSILNRSQKSSRGCFLTLWQPRARVTNACTRN